MMRIVPAALVAALALAPLGSAATTAGNGPIVFLRGARALHSIRPDGTGLRALPRLPVRAHGPAISADGRWLAFVGERTEPGRYDLFVRPLGATVARPVTDDERPEGRPSWSPDGRRLVYSAPSDDAPALQALYVVDVAGGGEPVRISRGAGNHAAPAWSPDGRTIAYAWRRCPDCNVTSLRAMNADGTRERVLALVHKTSVASDPSWSPDGRRLAFFWSHEIWTVRADGSQKRRLTRDAELDGTPVWSPDGQKLAWVRQQGLRPRTIYVINADGSGRRRLPSSFPSSAIGWLPAR
jgi:Tol biopolymer transport system component